MEKANKAELLRMKQEVENRAGGQIATRSPKLPSYTPSTPYNAPKPTGVLTPRHDNSMECYNCHRTEHLSRDCLAPRKQNNFQSSRYEADKTSKTNQPSGSQFKGGAYGTENRQTFKPRPRQFDAKQYTADAFCEYRKRKHHTRDQCQKLAKAQNLLTLSTPPSAGTQPK